MCYTDFGLGSIAYSFIWFMGYIYSNTVPDCRQGRFLTI